MSTFLIEDSQLQPLKGQVVIVTGGSSGIGLATVQLLLQIGAKVVMMDRNPPPRDLVSPDLTYLAGDVSVWNDVAGVFKKAVAVHGRVDHVFANAGISTTVTYTEDVLDENGDLLPPPSNTLDVNLMGVIYTVKLGIHYLKKQDRGGSIVMTASSAAFQTFEATDYTVAKHGVLGLLRGLTNHLHPTLPIRLNALAPSWTGTGLIPQEALEAIGIPFQTAAVVARSAALAMADPARHGQVLYSDGGTYQEVEGAMRDAVRAFSVMGALPLGEAVRRMQEFEMAGKKVDVAAETASG